MSARAWLGRTGQFRALMLLVAAALAGASGSAQAQYTEISLLDEHYSTTLSTSTTVPDCRDCATTTTTTVRQTTSGSPIESELQVADSVFAKATADTFSVSSEATAFIACRYCGPRAHATAETWLSFRVLQDSTALLTFSGGVQSFTSGFFSLFDQTAGSTLFSQSFGYFTGDPSAVLDVASVSFAAALDATHIYKLTLRGDSDANWDGWRMSLGVNGLHAIAAPVPEPEAWAMMLAGLGLVGSLARRRLRV